MCGRYTVTAPGAALAGLVDDPRAVEMIAALPPRYNIAPTQIAPVVRRGVAGSTVAELRWGLIPSFAKDATGAARAINARAESVLERPAFRDSVAERRCLVPADGFFEWRPDARDPKRKRPFFIHAPERQPFTFAGLWARWRPRGGGDLETFTILTTEPTQFLSTLHDRMPLVLRPEERRLWLEGSLEEVRAWLAHLPSREGLEFEAYAVSPRVNRPDPDDAELLTPAADEPEPEAKAAPPQLELF